MKNMKLNMSCRIERQNERHQAQDDDSFSWMNVLGVMLFFVELLLFWVVI